MTEMSISSTSLPRASAPSRTSRDYNLHTLLDKNYDRVLELLAPPNPQEEDAGLTADQLKALARDHIKAAFQTAAEEHYKRRKNWTLFGAGVGVAGSFAAGWLLYLPLAWGVAAAAAVGIGAQGVYDIQRRLFMRRQKTGPLVWKTDEPDPGAKGSRRIFEAAQKELEKITPKRAERILHDRMIELANE
jgi:hypothetical protein